MNHFKKSKQKLLRILLLPEPNKSGFRASLTMIISLFSKSIPALAALGLILGSILTYRYLIFIGYSSIFPETIASSSSLTTIIFVFALILLIFAIPFLSPYSFIFISKDLQAQRIKVKNLFPSLFASTLSFPILVIYLLLSDYEKINIPPEPIIGLCFLFTIISPYFIYIIQDKVNFLPKIIYRINYNKIFTALICYKNNTELSFDKITTIILYTLYSIYLLIIWLIALIPLIFFLIIYYFLTNYNIFLSFFRLLPTLALSFLIYCSIFIYSIFLIAFASNWLLDSYIKYTFLSFLYFFIFLNVRAVADEAYSKNNKNKNSYILSIMLAISSFFLMSVLSNNFSTHMLHPVRFVEIPKNSSWYLLHNNFQHNNGTQEINGIDKNDLFKLKQKFKCSALSENEKVKKGINCSSIPEQRNNALYGYMAWNLGDTKVFCPPTAENNKGKEEAAKLAKECIIINGKSLQILNENYIDIMPKER